MTVEPEYKDTGWTPINQAAPPDCWIVLAEAIDSMGRRRMFAGYLHHMDSTWYSSFPVNGRIPTLPAEWTVIRWRHIDPPGSES